MNNEDGAIIFIPRRTKERSYLREVTFHELAHAYAHWFKLPKYIYKVFGEFKDMSYLEYQYRIIKHYSGEPREGNISRYSEVSPEEDFAETFSFVVNGRKSFNGYKVDLSCDKLLSKKVKAVKRLLRIS
ncbi:putative zinc-binding metallopeptidase [Halobacteriovorax marinus]|uniref:putative zinc-binding metallopeptidase n=1 Tax=Halobacteriovorax marinus TaxID=97084 RepID=UPI003A93A0D1